MLMFIKKILRLGLKQALLLLSLIALISVFVSTTQMMPPTGGMMQGGMGGNNIVTTGTKCGTVTGSNLFTYTEVTDDASGTVTGYPGGYREITANSCPGYDWTSQTTGNTPFEQSIKMKLPLQPKISSASSTLNVSIKFADGTTNSSPVMNWIGVAVNGVTIFGNADGQKRDAFIYESNTILYIIY